MSDKRESVMLAHVFKEDRDNVIGWFMSEKYDGLRCFWDGGITRGLLCTEVPFANTDKHYRYIREMRATGLWTRYYQPINAPDWFLDKLPQYPLDGELYIGRGSFQETMSICKKLPEQCDNDGWVKIKYCVFDIPSLANFARPGRIKIPSFEKTVGEDVFEWMKVRIGLTGFKRPSVYTFEETYQYLFHKMVIDSPYLRFVLQTTVQSLEHMLGELDRVVEGGGEGLMLRKPSSHWKPDRSYDLLKVKKWCDAEATVVGYQYGTGKLLGLMGALIIDWNGKKFGLSGFTDQERILSTVLGNDNLAAEMARKSPEALARETIVSKLFPLGSKICFKYQELSVEGVPLKARYWRKYD